MNRFSRPYRKIVRSLATLVLAAALGAVALSTPAHAATSGCVVQYRILGQGPAGFAADLVLTNLGDPTSRWILNWQMNAGEQLGAVWSAIMGQSGTWITATNLPGAGSLATGAHTDFGWTASVLAPTTPPTAFWMNGWPCFIAPPAPLP
jgi:cellulase/cellobiase CelA1